MRYAFSVAAIALLVGFGGAVAYGQGDCEASRCAVQAAIDQQCPCSAASNHGRHVSCVAHVVNSMAKQGAIPTNCKGKVKRCAARSICGKEGFVTCQVPVVGICDTIAGTCVDNSAVTCATDADCTIGTRCHTKRSGELCTAAGGTVGGGSSCCADCVASVP
jgi:hypothetical protein